jgi:hypothetical protein
MLQQKMANSFPAEILIAFLFARDFLVRGPPQD